MTAYDMAKKALKLVVDDPATGEQLLTLRKALHGICSLDEGAWLNFGTAAIWGWIEAPLRRLATNGLLACDTTKFKLSGENRHFALGIIANLSPTRLSQLFVESNEFEEYIGALRARAPQPVSVAPVAPAPAPAPKMTAQERYDILTRTDVFDLSLEDRTALVAYQVYRMREDFWTAIRQMTESVLQPGLDALARRIEEVAAQSQTHPPSQAPVFPPEADATREGVVTALEIAAEAETIAATRLQEHIDRIQEDRDRERKVADHYAQASEDIFKTLCACAPDLAKFRSLVQSYHRTKGQRVSDKMRAILEQALLICAPDELKTTAGHQWLADHIGVEDASFITIRQEILSQGKGAYPLWVALEKGMSYPELSKVISKLILPLSATVKEKAVLCRRALEDHHINQLLDDV